MTLPDDLRKRLKKATPKPWKPRPSLLCRGNIPLPMHGLAARDVMGKPWWDKTRKEAYKSTQFHCAACSVHKENARYHEWLEGHEVYDVDYLLGRMKYVETVPLCHFCHNFIHQGRMRALLDKGLLHHAKYVAIIQHGDAILSSHGLRLERYEGPQASWEDWRLIVGRRTFRPLYKSFDEYRALHK